MITCPVCETENKDDALVCECCGERLAAPKPGEAVDPSELMASSLPPQPPPIAPPLPSSTSPRAGFAPIDDEFDSLSKSPAMTLDEAAAKARLAALASAVPPPQPKPAPAEKPAVLYSSLSGKAYPAGSPEYKEGFGPMGEELVAEPPADADMRETLPIGTPARGTPAVSASLGAAEAIYEMKTQPTPAVQMPQQAPPQPTQQPVEPLPAVSVMQPVNLSPTPEAPAAQHKPAPQASAKITIYHQRQPVHTHLITTDEVLLGRRDIRADIHPDVDLSAWDEAGHVSRKHAYIYRQNRVYTLYAVSNGGVQLNKDLLEIGDKRELRDGDVIVLAGVLAIKFEKL